MTPTTLFTAAEIRAVEEIESLQPGLASVRFSATLNCQLKRVSKLT